MATKKKKESDVELVEEKKTKTTKVKKEVEKPKTWFHTLQEKAIEKQ
jgi:hypothetical protein